MLRRCYDTTSKGYLNYGGRGITVSEEWNPDLGGSFVKFLEDMGPRLPGYSLDRIDVNGNYSKSNCRWATVLEQARNKRK